MAISADEGNDTGIEEKNGENHSSEVVSKENDENSVSIQATEHGQHKGDDNEAANINTHHKSPSESSIRAIYPTADSSVEHDKEPVSQDNDAIRQVSGQEGKGDAKEDAVDIEKGQTTMNKRGEAPNCLIAFRDRVEACSHRLQAWSDQQEIKARHRQQRRREETDGGVRVEEDGKVIEPKGDNLIQRKGIILLVAIILIWVYIVFVWRICGNAIRQEERATATRSEGIGFLVGFNILWLLTIWSYIKVVITGPGFVRDHVEISDQPSPDGDESFQYMQQQINSGMQSSGVEKGTANEEAINPSLLAAIGAAGAGLLAKADEAQRTDADLSKSNEQPSSKGTAVPDPEAWAGPKVENVQPSKPPLPEPLRVPQTAFPLRPSNTYCYRCQRHKPPRAHHCRHCGTCVLKMDHHCPWVGGCVGARNHKFFYNFLQWVTVLEYYVLIINALLFSRGMRRENWTIDGYMISLFPICAMFILFTTALIVTHTYLFIVNLSTIEHMGYERQKTREDILIDRWVVDLAQHEGRPKPDWFAQIRQRKALKKKWAVIWGKPKTEANLFWLDGVRKPMIVGKKSELPENQQSTFQDEEKSIKPMSWWNAVGPNWRQAMGDNIFGWFLPIGRSRNANGLAYEANWRFGPQGEWTLRNEWPKRLQNARK